MNVSLTWERVGNALCLDFTNTVNCWPSPERDLLTSSGDTAWWIGEVLGVDVPEPARTSADLRALRSLRLAVREVFESVIDGGAPSGAGMRTVVAAYRAALPTASWHTVEDRVESEWPAIERLRDLTAPVAASALDLLRSGPLHRLGRCPTCGWLFLDASKAGRRRWCSMSMCGGRSKSHAYLERRAKDRRPD